ncbi:putative secreted protein (Por secretion system target) [Neolewinella xylanilytica]|uniref:Putative secreted protein (Por secretion system target) n=1 Tax=Neolewinella xylanilytica TaxID=1514080 RepID=A0A2S6I297_9BACT|nr:T9SS type A sorting domain-containing protein [Neolewinella xylanilytica]PPK85306.1 putative secreted protein (Por secretion system target) [Neolewinella xylanilytica]
MTKRFTLLLGLALCGGLSVTAQMRYVDDMFDVAVTKDVVYGNNISVLTGTPQAVDLLTDVYIPEADTATSRPAVVLMHTGSFLPPYVNGGVTGARTDSAVVEIATRLASRGYVVFPATYRAGWNPFGDQDTRTGTLLNAAYRGGQDTHTAIRWLKSTVAEDSNPYGIDTTKLVVWGLGTGGYNVHTAAYLDRFEELRQDKWISSETGNIYVDEAASGDPLGLVEAPLNTPNHVGYTSNFQLGVNMGGALGDTTWIEGKDTEPALIGLHVVSDPFAPFANGPVIVPTTREFVVNVHGTNIAVREANEAGGNDVMSTVAYPDSINPSVFGPLAAFVSAKNAQLKNTMIDYQGQNIPLSRDNMYPFILPGLQAGPWDWYSKPQLDQTIAAINVDRDEDFDADELHQNSLITNPDLSEAKSNAYIDTTMAFFLPHACEALGLDCAPSITDVEELLESNVVGLTLSPNPAMDYVRLETAEAYPIRDIVVYTITGTQVAYIPSVNQSSYRLDRGNLPTGQYIVRVRVDEGITARKLFIR